MFCAYARRALLAALPTAFLLLSVSLSVSAARRVGSFTVHIEGARGQTRALYDAIAIQLASLKPAPARASRRSLGGAVIATVRLLRLSDTRMRVTIVRTATQRAFVQEVETTPGGRRSASHRAVAIQVREFVTQALQLRQGSSKLDSNPGAPDQAVVIVDEEPERPLRFSWLIELGALGASPSDSYRGQLGGVVATGMGLRRPRWFVEGLAGLRLMAASELVSVPEAHLSEIVVVGSARSGLAFGKVHVGGFLDVGSRFVRATGSTVDGQTGTVVAAVPMIAFGPELRFLLSGGLSIRAATGPEFSMKRLRFSAFGNEVGDLGVVRGVASVSLLAYIPAGP